VINLSCQLIPSALVSLSTINLLAISHDVAIVGRNPLESNSTIAASSSFHGPVNRYLPRIKQKRAGKNTYGEKNNSPRCLMAV
jgi:hypothetical protein